MAIAPFVRQFAGIDADWWAAQPWPRLHAWLAQWQASDLLASVMYKLPAWVDGTEGVLFAHPAKRLAPGAATALPDSEGR
jgi:hypothetical protein